MLTREPRVQPPALERYSELPLFNTKAVVRQTGVPAPTLRAWERRYGVLSPQRGGNDYRLYSERDMVIVTWLRERVESGMSISQAIALLRSMVPAPPRRVPAAHPATPSSAERGAMAPAGASAAAGEGSPLSLVALRQVLLGQLLQLAERGAMHTISEALAIYPVEEVCDALFTPVLRELGRLWAEGHIGVAEEHFGTAVIRAQLEGLFRCAPAVDGGPYLLVGCAPGNLHELGPLMLALFLRRLGVRVAYLGQSLEPASVAALATANQAACVVLSAALPEHAEAVAEVIRQLEAATGCVTKVCFGGWAFERDPVLAERTPGFFLGMHAAEAALEIKRRFAP
jgi:DNA-binding transcriptional MerR regulator/methylmalonyl-CoA mutase cobalamin-binding subunit